MKISELVKSIDAKTRKDVFLREKGAATRLVKAALMQLAKEIDAAGEGSVRVPGFGVFRITHKEVEKSGNQTMVRRIVFRPIVQKKLGNTKDDSASKE